MAQSEIGTIRIFEKCHQVFYHNSPKQNLVLLGVEILTGDGKPMQL